MEKCLIGALAAKDLDPVALLGVTESIKVADVGDRAAMEHRTFAHPAALGERRDHLVLLANVGARGLVALELSQVHGAGRVSHFRWGARGMK